MYVLVGYQVTGTLYCATSQISRRVVQHSSFTSVSRTTFQKASQVMRLSTVCDFRSGSIKVPNCFHLYVENKMKECEIVESFQVLHFSICSAFHHLWFHIYVCWHVKNVLGIGIDIYALKQSLKWFRDLSNIRTIIGIQSNLSYLGSILLFKLTIIKDVKKACCCGWYVAFFSDFIVWFS